MTTIEAQVALRVRAGIPARWIALALCLACGAAGCRTQGKVPEIELPSRHTIRGDQLLVMSDFHLPADHELIRDLKTLRLQVYEQLELPVQRQPVVVYLFDNETSYRQYLGRRYPNLPHRRAYFFKTARELAVFTYWGERVQEDLRHEFTHGLLHASLKTVPLWLDEGLAEYFEVVAPEPGAMNSNYPDELVGLLGKGWEPDLTQLEALEEFSAMERVHYQEAWAWVHFMLHSSPDARAALLGYLQDLRTQSDPYPLSKRLKADFVDVEARFTMYLATLNSFHRATPNRVAPMLPVETAAAIPASRATLARAETQPDLPPYQLTLPQHVRGRMVLTGAEGHVSFGDGPTIFRQAHRHGWDDFLRAFLAGDVELSDTQAIERFAADPGTEYWQLAQEARAQGVLDCYRALIASSSRTGAELLRHEYGEQEQTGR